MEKIAQEIHVIDQSRTLISVGETMAKIAEEIEDEGLATLALDTYQAGERLGAALVKTAAESGEALEESLELAEDMNKLASVYAELADESGEETLVKMAEAMIEIANEMADDANEFYKTAAGSGIYDRAGKEYPSTQHKEGFFKRMKHHLGTAAKHGYGGGAWKAEEARHLYHHAPKGEKLKHLFSTKTGLKALSRPGIAYGTAGAALAGLGYGVHRATHHHKK
jgi:hypothetical protein